MLSILGMCCQSGCGGRMHEQAAQRIMVGRMNNPFDKMTAQDRDDQETKISVRKPAIWADI